jgi:hypothetical protein
MPSLADLYSGGTVVNEMLLQVNFNYRGAGNIYQEVVAILASTVSNTPGLIWKTWLINEQQAEGGGLYLFYDHASLERYLQGTLKVRLEAQQGVCNVSIKTFCMLNEIPLVAIARWQELRSKVT